MGEVVFGHGQFGLGGLKGARGHVAVGASLVHGVLRHALRLLVPGEVRIGVELPRLALGDLRLCVLEGRLVLDRIEAEEDLALLHERAVGTAHLKYFAADLRRKVDALHGNDPTGVGFRLVVDLARHLGDGQGQGHAERGSHGEQRGRRYRDTSAHRLSSRMTTSAKSRTAFDRHPDTTT